MFEDDILFRGEIRDGQLSIGRECTDPYILQICPFMDKRVCGQNCPLFGKPKNIVISCYDGSPFPDKNINAVELKICKKTLYFRHFKIY